MARRKTAESATVVRLDRAPSEQAFSGARLATVLGPSRDGETLVDVPGMPGPRVARSIVRLTEAQLQADAHTEVLVVFDEPTGLPVIVGVLRARRVEPEQAPASKPNPVQPLTADIDGNRVTLTAQHEIVLKCGDAEIVLRKNGRILIRGVHVETRSKGLNRIKGGAVHIN